MDDYEAEVIMDGQNICKYDEAFTVRDMHEETGFCEVCPFRLECEK